MMHPFKTRTLLAFCHRADGAVARSTLRVNGAVELWRDLEVFSVTADSEDFDRLVFETLDVEKYLDRFLLLLPRDDADRHLTVVEGFFAFISDRYESFIDRARNLGNIRVLTRHLSQVLGIMEGERRIVDFGCGTGLSLDIDTSLEIIGVDRCEEMRTQARARGMTVLSMEEFADLLPESFDGAFASYVLHLSPPERDLEILWARLKPGGAFVANFHKDRGVDFAVSTFVELGADVRLGAPVALSRIHGTYVTFYKPDLAFSICNPA